MKEEANEPDLSRELLYLSLLLQEQALMRSLQKIATRIEVFLTAFPQRGE